MPTLSASNVLPAYPKRRWESALEPPPEIKTDSCQEKKKIESVFDDQLVYINLNNHDNERQ
jgi:hypothetical protein